MLASGEVEPSIRQYRAHREQAVENRELIRVSASVPGHDDIVASRKGGRTFSIVTVRSGIAIIITTVTILPISITINWAARAASVIVVTVSLPISVAVTSIVLAGREFSVAAR